ncbi:FKBP-type peptidyl-prolyl cis-trans isomerase [candidate division KSB1 bacterium]
MKEMNRNEMIAVTVAVIVVVIILLIGILNTLSNNAAQNRSVTVETNMEQEHGTGLITKDVVIGEGEEAVAGLTVTTHYTGTLDDGTVFDSSVTRGAPFSFTLGVGQVIKGWDLGIAGMKVGGKRELTIPANLAYGDRAIGAIPAGSTLHFEVELLGVGTVQ